MRTYVRTRTLDRQGWERPQAEQLVPAICGDFTVSRSPQIPRRTCASTGRAVRTFDSTIRDRGEGRGRCWRSQSGIHGRSGSRRSRRADRGAKANGHHADRDARCRLQTHGAPLLHLRRRRRGRIPALARILLTKAPPLEGDAIVRWMQVVTKREALAVRRQRERLLSGTRPAGEDDDRDPLDSIASESAGPNEQAASRERVTRSREALRALKPQEVRAMTLKAQGYSYAEIGESTGWTYTKINRATAEGRKCFPRSWRRSRKAVAVSNCQPPSPRSPTMSQT